MDAAVAGLLEREAFDVVHLHGPLDPALPLLALHAARAPVVGTFHAPLEAGLRILVWTGTPLLVAPVAGALADRFGNRPFMLTGLVLQAVGLGLMAWQVEPGVGYDRLVVPIIETVRGLLLGTPIGNDGIVAVAWCAVISVGSYLWARTLYERDPSPSVA
jgi:MFS family permease